MPVSALAWASPITFLLCGLALILAARNGLPTAQWGRALCLLGGGFGLMAIPTRDFSTIKPLAEDLLIILGTTALCRALGQRFRLHPNPNFEIIVIVLAMSLAGGSLAISQSHKMEAFFIQFGCTILLAFRLHTIRNAVSTKADKVLFYTFLPLTIFVGAQCIFYIFAEDTPPIVGAWRESFWGMLIQYTGIMVAVPLSFAAMFAVSLDFINFYREHAHIDPLTRILNRRGLEAFFLSAKEAGRLNKPASAFVADIDRFKSINDRFGHNVGDRVIAGFAALLQSQIDAKGCAARLGGEEFVVLLPDTSLDEAAAIADQIRVAFKASHWPDIPGDPEFTASFGVSFFSPADSIASLLARGDECLYRAKQGGRDLVVPDSARIPALTATLSAHVPDQIDLVTERLSPTSVGGPESEH